ncbi:acyl-CoA thioesterase II [Frankia sp. Cas3]|uniref:acyl-CoA thioesterase n=1 Tax=Frankia sp. Cas3 TaxID=3073926 RepID=UPI002AD570DB|nr:acyl-CoA thioesterase II [Frankia sp. Cas3]
MISTRHQRPTTLVGVLDLERLDVDIFRGWSSHGELPVRLFGGQVAGQALIAAGRTVEPARSVHSLHAYFLRPGDPAVPVIYLVDRIRDGGSYSTRRVVGVQLGETIFQLSASFHLPAQGPTHAEPMPLVPPPDQVRTLEDWYADAGAASAPWMQWFRAGQFRTEVRCVDEPPALAAERGPRPARQRVWFRSAEPLPDDPLVHVCALTYASDLDLISTALLPHGRTTRDAGMASLDHAVWFHRPFRADGWLLHDRESPVAAGGHALVRAHVYDADGYLVASIAQEGLVRTPRREPEQRVTAEQRGPMSSTSH